MLVGLECWVLRTATTLGTFFGEQKAKFKDATTKTIDDASFCSETSTSTINSSLYDNEGDVDGNADEDGDVNVQDQKVSCSTVSNPTIVKHRTSSPSPRRHQPQQRRKQRKGVSFSPMVQVRKTIHRGNYTSQEKSDCWYNREELNQFCRHDLVARALLEKGLDIYGCEELLEM